ncbi:MAG: hypothetical protein LBO05_01205 [Deltaproteobacteria bacterium]|jgi:hypothetical protein|nr:hypothetical protein [Deltaproteobacteria bacterium]
MTPKTSPDRRPDSRPASLEKDPGGRGRLIAVPFVSPEGLGHPGPVFYLTWPSWESFRLDVLGQQKDAPGFAALTVPDPPGFQESFRGSLALLRDRGGDLHPSFPASKAVPLAEPFETVQEVVGALGGRGGAGAGTSEPPGTSPALPYLSLALWGYSRHLAAQADSLMGEATLRRADLLVALRGEETYEDGSEDDLLAADSSPGGDLSPDGEDDGPNPDETAPAAVLASFLQIFASVRRPGDVLLAASAGVAEEVGEMAPRLGLAGVGIRVRDLLGAGSGRG